MGQNKRKQRTEQLRAEQSRRRTYQHVEEIDSICRDIEDREKAEAFDKLIKQGIIIQENDNALSTPRG